MRFILTHLLSYINALLTHDTTTKGDSSPLGFVEIGASHVSHGKILKKVSIWSSILQNPLDPASPTSGDPCGMIWFYITHEGILIWQVLKFGVFCSTSSYFWLPQALNSWYNSVWYLIFWFLFYKNSDWESWLKNHF
jgi:hypothetical protein